MSHECEWGQPGHARAESTYESTYDWRYEYRHYGLIPCSRSTRLGFELTAFLGGALIALVVGGFAISLIARTLDHHYAKQGCENWGKIMDREVVFADYSFWNYECLVNVDGRLVPKESIIPVDGTRIIVNMEEE